MPHMRPLTLAVIGFIAVSALAVLYVMIGRPVHSGALPASLEELKPSVPKGLPRLVFEDARGKPHSLSDFHGRYVLLNLWATWCAPCVRELPDLARLQAAMPEGGLKVVAVNVWHSNPAETLAFLNAHDASGLSAYFDPHTGMMTVFGQVGLPFSVLVDPEGREVARALGPAQWDDPTAIAYFKSLGEHASS